MSDRRTSSALHIVAHWLGWNLGRVSTFKANGHWYIAHLCSTCGEHTGVEHMKSCDCEEQRT